MPTICVVHGYGLMELVEQDASVVEVRGHGSYQDGDGVKGRYWFPKERIRILDATEAVIAVSREQAEAGARGVGCNSPGCWCSQIRGAEATFLPMPTVLGFVCAVDKMCEYQGDSHAVIGSDMPASPAPVLLCGRSAGDLNWTRNPKPKTQLCTRCARRMNGAVE